jgi:tRNA pseudouridine38-40 synthase
MYYYKLIIAYDGYDYHGWQWQPTKKAVANQLEKSFKKAFHQEPLSLVGASRTDTGVHAWGQVARVKTAFYLEPDVLKRAWQGALPHTILLRSVEAMPGDFDLQEGVEHKTYDYYFSRVKLLPFIGRYCIPYYGQFDAEVLQKNLDVFLGTHDFRSFCTGDDKENTVRTIESISVTYLRRFNVYRIRIKGPGFLRYMVRRIVGASLQTMTMQLEEKLDNAPNYLNLILKEKNPKQNLKTAPAHGLMLRSITYGNKS